MALSASAAQTGSNNSASTTKLVVPTTNIPQGHVALLCIAYDNAGTAGADPFSGITDNKSNTWSYDQQSLNNPGINAGVAGRISSTLVTGSGGLTTSDTITVAFGGVSVTAFVWVLYDLTAAAGSSAQENSEGQASQTSATPSITTASIASGHLLVACIGREANGTRTDDADTSNGSWANTGSVGVGTTTSGVEIICQTKVATGTATQTYNPTFGGASADGVNLWVDRFEGARGAIAFTATAADTVTHTDSAARSVNTSRTAGDTVSVSDAATRVATLARAIADTVTHSDAATRVGTFLRSVADTVTHSDAATRVGTFLRTAGDTVSVSDAATATRTFLRTAADTVSVSDAATRVLTLGRTAADTVTHSDAATRVVTAVRTAADTVAHSDAASRVVTAVRTAADTVTHSDTAARVVSALRTAADTVTHSDAAVRTVTAVRSAADAVGFSDIATRAVAAVRTASDTVSVSDSVIYIKTVATLSSGAATVRGWASAVASFVGSASRDEATRPGTAEEAPATGEGMAE